MIAVIADDFTGAAEISGIGLRRGLSTFIETDVENAEDADLLIIATDTRSESPENAVRKIEKVTRSLLNFNPSFIYKKLDSVLRGNVVAELDAQLRSSGRKKALVIAGNPRFGRIIKNGIIYIEGIPIENTFFSEDPDFPIRSSRVCEIIGAGRKGVFCLTPDQPQPSEGLVFGDIVTESDFDKWAGLTGNDCISAGGAGFFDVLLNRLVPRTTSPVNNIYRLGEKVLFVFGSAYPKNQAKNLFLSEMGFVFMNIPEQLYLQDSPDYQDLLVWVEAICARLSEGSRVIISVNNSNGKDTQVSSQIRECMGMVVKEVFSRISIDDLLIEGGATASIILKYLEIKKLYPFRELEQGVIQMKVKKYPHLCVTTKPGSYSWPASLMINSDHKDEKNKTNHFLEFR
jgi:D-threonate/D-erythronate kinase